MASDDRAAVVATLRDRASKLLQQDLFAVLGVPRTASTDDVGKAYLDAVKVFHPDRSPSPDLRPLLTKAFARIDLAKTTLSDPARRAKYVEEITKPAAPADRSAAEADMEHRKAEAFIKTHDPVRAEQHLKRAVRLAPANVEYAAALISVQAGPDVPSSRLEELAAELDALIKRASDSERALFTRAQIRKRLGRLKEAMSDFARVVELNPSNLEATRELRIHKMRTEDKTAATESGGIGGMFRRLFGSKR